MAVPQVLACRPRDLDLTDSMDLAISQLTFVYDGSVEGKCKLCWCVVQVGPKQQAHLRARPKTTVMCFRCVVALSGGNEMDIRSLGNPEPPR